MIELLKLVPLMKRTLSSTTNRWVISSRMFVSCMVCLDDSEEVEHLTKEVIQTLEKICGETLQF